MFLHNNNFIKTITKQYFNSKTSSIKNMSITNLKQIFLSGVESVLPDKIISENVKLEKSDLLSICDKKYQLSNGCHLVGFGKAVLNMALKLESLLAGNLKGGIISVPQGIQNETRSTCLTILEGAENNLPDENAENNAKRIVEYILQLNKNATVFVLISGGGSALFPLPKPPLKLAEKLAIVKHLAASGADIMEVNSVRKRLSLVKGGGLARIAYPRRIVSLILSDVIGDPIDFIASGPTSVNFDSKSHLKSLYEKYELQSFLSEEAFFSDTDDSKVPVKNNNFVNVDNFVLGNNKTALDAAKNKAMCLGYVPCILSSEISGNVTDISLNYALLVTSVVKCLELDCCVTDNIFDESVVNFLKLDREMLNNLIETICLSKKLLKPICLILGGEPTVIVKGHGKGGRSQQLALQFSLDIKRVCDKGLKGSVMLLCAGTDGMDGPTDAAGAIGFAEQVEMAAMENLNCLEYLKNNNSYEYFSRLNNGTYLIRTGHTGTNVMDLHCLYIDYWTCYCKI